MNAIGFRSQVGEDLNLKIPDDIAAQLSVGQEVRVILMVRDDDDEQAWAAFTAEQFLAGYDPSDAIYDEPDVPAR